LLGCVKNDHFVGDCCCGDFGVGNVVVKKMGVKKDLENVDFWWKINQLDF
jgi:hypothetical protein